MYYLFIYEYLPYSPSFYQLLNKQLENQETCFYFDTFIPSLSAINSFYVLILPENHFLILFNIRGFSVTFCY